MVGVVSVDDWEQFVAPCASNGVEHDCSYEFVDGWEVESFRTWLAEVIRAAREEGFQAGWWASGEGFNGEYPDEGVPWEASVGKEAYEGWITREEQL